MNNQIIPKPKLNDYPMSRPEAGTAVYLLSILVVIGLIALFIAANHAFSQIMTWYQAAFAALLIEAGLVIEAIAFIRSKGDRWYQRNPLAAGGLLVTVLVSLTYNYIQADLAGGSSGITNEIELFALAVGPLSALVFVALTLGKEIDEHEKDINQWQIERQTWFECETKSYRKTIAGLQRYGMRLESQKQKHSVAVQPMRSVSKRGGKLNNRKPEVAPPVEQTGGVQSNKKLNGGNGSTERLTSSEAQDALLVFFTQNKEGTYREAAVHATRSPAWVSGKVAEFIECGTARRTDEGIEILSGDNGNA